MQFHDGGIEVVHDVLVSLGKKIESKALFLLDESVNFFWIVSDMPAVADEVSEAYDFQCRGVGENKVRVWFRVPYRMYTRVVGDVLNRLSSTSYLSCI